VDAGVEVAQAETRSACRRDDAEQKQEASQAVYGSAWPRRETKAQRRTRRLTSLNGLSMIVDMDLTHTPPAVARTAPRPAKVAVICRECGRRWKVSQHAVSLDCARCGGADVEVYEPALDTLKRIE